GQLAAEEAREAGQLAAEAREAGQLAAEAREAGRRAAKEAREASRRAAKEAREAGRRAAEEAREAAGLAGKVTDSVREAQGRSGGSFSRAVPFLASWIGLFALGIVLLGIWPEGVRNVRRTAAAAPLRGAVVGFLLVMALSALTPLLAITIVGIPVVVALWLGLIGVSLLGFVGLAERLGELLPGGNRASREVLLLLGAALALLPLLLPSPFLAVPVICLLWFLAVGISVLSRLGRRPYG
ncbi:hypothetical protein L6R50_15705, partial [Myxococcota bacterium]|nr:hypothetical protein [Myxococcota bacterium]